MLFAIVIFPVTPDLLFPSLAVIFTGPSTLLYVSLNTSTPSVNLTEVIPRVPVPFVVKATTGELLTILFPESLAVIVIVNPFISTTAGAVTVYDAITDVVVIAVAPTILPDTAVIVVEPAELGVTSNAENLPSTSLMQDVLSKVPPLDAIVIVCPLTPFASISFIVPSIITACPATQVAGDNIMLILLDIIVVDIFKLPVPDIVTFEAETALIVRFIGLVELTGPPFISHAFIFMLNG